MRNLLVGGFNPFEKYARQNGNLPQIEVKKKIFETTTQFTDFFIAPSANQSDIENPRDELAIQTSRSTGSNAAERSQGDLEQ